MAVVALPVQRINALRESLQRTAFQRLDRSQGFLTLAHYKPGLPKQLHRYALPDVAGTLQAANLARWKLILNLEIAAYERRCPLL